MSEAARSDNLQRFQTDFRSKNAQLLHLLLFIHAYLLF